MRQARAWPCISPHVVPGMKPHHPQRVVGGTQRATHTPQAREGKMGAPRPPILPGGPGSRGLARDAGGRHTGHEETTPHAHEAIVRPPYLQAANPHMLEPRLPHRPRRPATAGWGNRPGAGGGSDDTGPDLRIKLPACHHQHRGRARRAAGLGGGCIRH